MHFTIDSAEGLPIRGEIDAPRDPRALLVVVHGFKGFKNWGFYPWMAGHLSARHHVAVCRFNMSRSGIGEDPESFDRLDLFAGDSYSTQLADLRVAVAHAQSRFPLLSTFLLGHSRGGGIALLGADDVPRLEGVITWSAIARADRWDEATKEMWRRIGYLDVLNTRTQQVMRMSTSILDDYDANCTHLDILAATARLRVPLLALHGGNDESVPVEEATLIADRAPDASRVIIANASHTYNAMHPLVNVPFALTMATELAAHFIAAYE